MSKVVKRLLAAVVLLVLGGCQSTLMTKSDKTDLKPAADQAEIVFLRPSSLGGAIQSTVYRVDADQNGQQFIGVVSSKTKVAYTIAPGDYLFMVIAENADFMDAHLEAGKTYYALVSPRIGVWKARFSLLPIHNDPSAKYNTQSSDFAKWQSATTLVESLPQAQQWYVEHKDEVDDKRVDYLKEWNSRTAEDKADLVLHKQDGY